MEPSSFVIAKTSFRTLALFLTYFQKSDGLFLTLMTRLVSNDDLAVLMEIVAAFLCLVYEMKSE